MVIGKRYSMGWITMGCPRTAFFVVEGFTKAGKARGKYTDADGKVYTHSVAPKDFARWSPA